MANVRLCGLCIQKTKVRELQKTISSAKKKNYNIDSFLKLVRRYTDIRELNAEIIREFIQKIIVYKAENINGQRTQRIQIIYNCIGAVDITEKGQKKSA